MRRTSVILTIAAALSAPAMGTAQVADHVSLYRGGGLGLRSYSSFGAGFGFSVGGWGASLGFSLGFGSGFFDNYHGLYRPYNTPFVDCWDDYWYDPYYTCQEFGPFWGPGYGWTRYNPWRFGFLGWPSPRYVGSHWYGFSPFWGDYWGPSWGGYDHWYGPRYRHYYDYPGTRVVRRTPLYGPRFKEYPAPPVYVTDNGPERPVSRLGGRRGAGQPVGDVIGRDDRGAYSRGGARRARPRDGSDARPTPPRVRARPRAEGSANPTPRARPRSGTDGSDEARPRDTRTVRPGVVRRPPIVTSRPGTRTPSTRSAPARIRQPTPIRSAPPRVRSRPTTPRERIEPPRREAPGVRSGPSRRPSPTARSFPTRMPTTRARPAPSRSPTPRVRSAPSRGSAPKARPAPSRAPKPKARSAPSRSSGNKKSRPRRPARRPGN